MAHLLPQGSFLVCIDASRLQPLADLKAEMDRMVSAGERMQPLPTMDQAHLPGGREMEAFAEFSESGIPLGLDQVLGMQEEADIMGVPLPWDRVATPSKL